MSEMIERVGDAIMRDLLDRRGIRHVFDEIDADVLAEIRDSVGRVAITAMRESTPAMALPPTTWPPMRPMSEAPKDGTRILAVLKIPHNREDLRRWDGIPFVASHPGLADDGFDIGWTFGAPVGQCGFPDDWFVGWYPLPSVNGENL